MCDVTDNDKKQCLRHVLDGYAHVHCYGCDEWQCPHTPGEDKKLLEEMVENVWMEISSWKEE